MKEKIEILVTLYEQDLKRLSDLKGCKLEIIAYRQIIRDLKYCLKHEK